MKHFSENGYKEATPYQVYYQSCLDISMGREDYIWATEFLVLMSDLYLHRGNVHAKTTWFIYDNVLQWLKEKGEWNRYRKLDNIKNQVMNFTSMDSTRLSRRKMRRRRSHRSLSSSS
jgi:hypothetical protein